MPQDLTRVYILLPTIECFIKRWRLKCWGPAHAREASKIPRKWLRAYLSFENKFPHWDNFFISKSKNLSISIKAIGICVVVGVSVDVGVGVGIEPWCHQPQNPFLIRSRLNFFFSISMKRRQEQKKKKKGDDEEKKRKESPENGIEAATKSESLHFFSFIHWKNEKLSLFQTLSQWWIDSIFC